MKKIYYLFSWVAVAIAFASCHPLDKTYKALDGLPKPATTLNYTLLAADYALLPSTVPAKTSLAFASTADANTNIPTILNYKFFDYGDGSNANVTFTIAAPPAIKIKLADSVYKDITYTLTDADYLLLPGNKYKDFSIAQIISWFQYSTNPILSSPKANQLGVVTFNYYNGSTTTQTFSFLYLNGAWQQIYMITPAQYVSVNRGGYNQFTSADDANLNAYLAGLLKADIGLTSIAVAGEVQYVSFNYYSSTKVTSQRVIPFYFDGTKWGTNSPGTSTATLPFGKTKGAWLADQTVYLTLSAADITTIVNGKVGGDANSSELSDLAKYGDFSGWSAANLQAAMILVLTTDFPNPKINVNYKVTYLLYSGKDIPTVLTFQNNGTAWVAK